MYIHPAIQIVFTPRSIANVNKNYAFVLRTTMDEEI